MHFLIDPTVWTMITGDVVFLALLVLGYSLYKRDSESPALTPGTVLEYRNLGNRKPKLVPQVVIHSVDKDFYLTRIQSRDKRHSQPKLYRLKISEAGQYFSLAS